MDPRSFLDTIRQYVRQEVRQNRMATIDPAYVRDSYAAGTLPKVIFDGETAPTTKRYAVAGAYWPSPGDRVLMVPVGITYVIVNSVPLSGEALAVTQDSDTTDFSFTNTSASATASTSGSVATVGRVFRAPPSGAAYITVSALLSTDSTANAANMSWELRSGNVIGSGTLVLGANAERAYVNSVRGGASYRHLVTGLTPGSQYNVRLVHWVNPAGTGTCLYRGLLIEPRP